jgi:hypothetical protein
MTYEELLADIASKNYRESRTPETPYAALRSVMELCKDWQTLGNNSVPIEDVIKAIEEELV